MKPAWCATCCEPSADLTRAASGHYLCPDCSPDVGERMPAGVSSARGYDVPERHAPLGRTSDAFAAGLKRVDPHAGTIQGKLVRAVSPGFIAVRVARRCDGRSIDRDEALQTLRFRPWFAELRHLGSDARWHFFERPDVELARKVRGESGVDAAAGLAALAGKVR